MTIPWITKANGYTNRINGQLLHVEATTSLQFRDFLKSETLEFALECNYPLVWNEHQLWKINLTACKATIHVIFSHKWFFQGRWQRIRLCSFFNILVTILNKFIFGKKQITIVCSWTSSRCWMESIQWDAPNFCSLTSASDGTFFFKTFIWTYILICLNLTTEWYILNIIWFLTHNFRNIFIVSIFKCWSVLRLVLYVSLYKKIKWLFL